MLTALAPPPEAGPKVRAEADGAREHLARVLYAYLHRWRDPYKNPGLVGKQLHEAFHLADVCSEEVFQCKSQRLRL